MKCVMALGAALLLMAGCAVVGDEIEHPASVAGKQREEIRQELLSIGKSYREWAQVSDGLAWAVTTCVPRVVSPPSNSFEKSEAPRGSPHGQKLYQLYAKNVANYPAGNHTTSQSQPSGQVIVKQSWAPAEVSTAEAQAEILAAQMMLREPKCIAADDKYWTKGEQRELFVMVKNEPGAQTDQGWTYAVLTPDGSGVIRSGMLADCMECHAKAPFDRLFGTEYARARKAQSDNQSQ